MFESEAERQATLARLTAPEKSSISEKTQGKLIQAMLFAALVTVGCSIIAERQQYAADQAKAAPITQSDLDSWKYRDPSPIRACEFDDSCPK